MKLSVIVPAYNEEDLLPLCLESIQQSFKSLYWPDSDWEIIVTDNNSNDNTAEIAKSFGAKVVFEAHNQISKARNTGAKEALGDWFLFIDADTRLNSEILRETLEGIKSGSVCGGGAIPRWDKPTRFGSFLLFIWVLLAKRLKLAAGSYIFCSAASFREIGGFSEKVYASEEVWLSRSLRKWGKAKREKFVVLNLRYVTSARKLQLYGNWYLLKYIVRIMLFPFQLKNRAKCGIWYQRHAPKP